VDEFVFWGAGFEDSFLGLGGTFDDPLEISANCRSLAGFILMVGSIGPQFWVVWLMGGGA